MDILIIDDNAAITEVLTDIIGDAGHNPRVAGSFDEAFSVMDSFVPDIVFLDMDLDGADGLEIADRIEEMFPDINIIILRSWNEQIPRDNVVIAGFIQKPFTSSDILGIIDKLESEENKEQRKVRVEEKRIYDDEVTSLEKRGLSFGVSYVLFRNDPRTVGNVVSSFGKEGYDILMVTTGKRKAVEERFRHNGMDVHFMNIKFMGGYFNIYKLGSMVDAIRQFIAVREMPVVIFENIDQMINRNGLNYVLTAINQSITADHGKKASFFVCVDASRFTDKDKEILSYHMEEYNPIEE